MKMGDLIYTTISFDKNVKFKDLSKFEKKKSKSFLFIKRLNIIKRSLRNKEGQTNLIRIHFTTPKNVSNAARDSTLGANFHNISDNCTTYQELI